MPGAYTVFLADCLGHGRMPRHQQLNDLVYRSLCKADAPAVKEPTGLIVADGKRPDGMSLIPWLQGRRVAWDVTVIDTLAISYVSSDPITSGHAANIAADRKMMKYSGLPNTFLFQPLAFETMGPINESGVEFLSELGRRLKLSSGDAQAAHHLFQQFSMLVQRFNAVAFKGCFAAPPESDT